MTRAPVAQKCFSFLACQCVPICALPQISPQLRRRQYIATAAYTQGSEWPLRALSCNDAARQSCSLERCKSESRLTCSICRM
eukprot:6596461-Pyramimonas_sp.AAC.1